MASYKMKNLILLAASALFFLNSCHVSKKASQRLFNDAKTKEYDIIVVPGVPFNNGKWGWIMKGRVYWSKFLFDKGIAKNIMYSGSAVYSPYYEAEIMALYAQDIGIPKDHIFTETKAEHSTENIYYSYQKAKELGFDKIALASDPFQTKMLKRFCRKKIRPDVGLIPFVVDTLEAMEPVMIDPEIDYKQAFAENFVSLKEREGFWKRFRGTRGKNIDYSAYE
jgi:uncharacterized SAM-binding protein YcdF (DUF218 family)